MENKTLIYILIGLVSAFLIYTLLKKQTPLPAPQPVNQSAGFAGFFTALSKIDWENLFKKNTDNTSAENAGGNSDIYGGFDNIPDGSIYDPNTDTYYYDDGFSNVDNLA